MRIYTVHMRSGALEPERDLKLVKEGFSWPAFVFSFFWALWHRLWWEALALFAFTTGVNLAVAGAGFGETAAGAVSLAVAIAVGLLANDLHRKALRRKGFVETEVVAAPNRETALGRFLDSRPELAAWVAG